MAPTRPPNPPVANENPFFGARGGTGRAVKGPHQEKRPLPEPPTKKNKTYKLRSRKKILAGYDDGRELPKSVAIGANKFRAAAAGATTTTTPTTPPPLAAAAAAPKVTKRRKASLRRLDLGTPLGARPMPGAGTGTATNEGDHSDASTVTTPKKKKKEKKGAAATTSAPASAPATDDEEERERGYATDDTTSQPMFPARAEYGGGGGGLMVPKVRSKRDKNRVPGASYNAEDIGANNSGGGGGRRTRSMGGVVDGGLD